MQPTTQDSRRFSELYRETSDRVTAYARSRLPPDQAADVVSETYLVAWRRLADVPERPLPWLLVTARNLIARHDRGSLRNGYLVAEIERLHDLLPGAVGDIADEVGERLTVLSALDTLPAADREVLLLAAWDGLSPREAGAVLGCSGPTFSVRLHRARTRLTRAVTDADASPARSGTRTGSGLPTSPDLPRAARSEPPPPPSGRPGSSADLHVQETT